MKTQYSKRIMLGFLGACLLTAAGCSASKLQNAPEAPLPANESSAEYIDRIAGQTTVSESDAMRGILLLLDGKDAAGSFDERVAALKERGIVAASWDCRPQRPLTRGKMAYMIYLACDVPGGVILTLTGPSQRYCLRELQYRGFVGQGAVYSDVPGMEFVAVLTRADSCLQTGKVPKVLATNEGR